MNIATNFFHPLFLANCKADWDFVVIYPSGLRVL